MMSMNGLGGNMAKLTKEEFVDKCTDLVEEYFPKGKTEMRGEAMVLVAMITIYLTEQGAISYLRNKDNSGVAEVDYSNHCSRGDNFVHTYLIDDCPCLTSLPIRDVAPQPDSGVADGKWELAPESKVTKTFPVHYGTVERTLTPPPTPQPDLDEEIMNILNENTTHYERVCLVCGHTWLGLHCPHDRYQNPCPGCGSKPRSVTTLLETDCQGLTDFDEVRTQIKALIERNK